jgi:hypothetical protein
MRARLVIAVVVEKHDNGVLDGPLHSLAQSSGPTMVGLGHRQDTLKNDLRDPMLNRQLCDQNGE